MHKALMLLAALGIVLAVCSGAYAAKGLLTGADIKHGSITGANIADHTLGESLFTASAKESLAGKIGPRGFEGNTGAGGTPGSPGLAGGVGSNGAAGPAGAAGSVGATGISGSNGLAGATGATGAVGPTGPSGAVGATGSVGATGASGSNGLNGTVTPLSALAGLTALPTAAPLTTVVSLTVPAGTYVILGKTQLAQTGAGDSVDCSLKVGATTADQISMKTLPALAAVPAALEAVATVSSSSLLSIQCLVEVANGTANFSSLIAIPTS